MEKGRLAQQGGQEGLPRIQIEEQKLFYQGSSIQEEHAEARSGNTSDMWGKERGNQVHAHKGIFFLYRTGIEKEGEYQ